MGEWPVLPTETPPPPRDEPWLGVPTWRGDALLQEATSGPGGSDLTGGWLAGGGVRNVKLTSTVAYTTALTAWSVLQFPSSYAAASPSTLPRALDAVKWGGDYLMKASASTGVNGTALVAQVGNVTAERFFWGRPEEIEGARPSFIVDVGTGAADLASATSAALAAAAVALKDTDAAWSADAVARARRLYAQARVAPGFWWETAGGDEPYSGLAPEGKMTTQYDKMLWAAGWLVRERVWDGGREQRRGGRCVCFNPPLPPPHPQYRATANDTYLLHASSYFVRYIYDEGGGSRSSFSPDAYFTAASALLANATDGGTYHERARAGLRSWACADGTSVKYTPRGRVSLGERER